MNIMQPIFAILSNKIILGTISASLIAQTLKIFFMGIKHKKLDFSYAFSMSGMPSGHTSGIIALTTLIGLKTGFDSTLFALSFCIAIVIMYDAVGVRQQSGKHAEMLNYLLDKYTIYTNEKEDSQHYLPIRIGHNLPEVVAGIVNGVCCSLLFVYLFGI